MEQLLTAIQARKLDRIAAGYAVGAWLLVQAASIALPAFDAPGWMLKALIVFAVLGFPLTLLLAWMSAPHLPGSAVPSKPLAPVRVATLVVIFVVAVLSLGELAYVISHRGTRDTAEAPPEINAASIAVLPFVNMSGNSSTDYFSDGISEELLDHLANLPELRVAARTSSFAFKGKNENIKTIADRLGVRSVLEGSVRAEGRHLRIHAELIDAPKGYAIWSATFDRDMTSALAVQDEIAQAIVGALTHKLLPARPRPNRPKTIDPDAYRDYLAAQFAFAPRTEAGSKKAIDLFQKAIARQPDFAEAYIGLARAYMDVADNHLSQKDLVASANAALTRGLALDPNNLEGLGAHLDSALRRMDWRTAALDAKRMQSINPHSAAVLHEMFRYYQALGFPEEALAAAKGAAQLNRLSFVDLLNIAAADNHLNRFADAAKAGEDARALEPNSPDVISYLCTAYAHGNQPAKAHAMEQQLMAMGQAAYVQGCRFDIAISEGRKKEAIAILDKLAGQYPNGGLAATDLGDSYAGSGDYPAAINWLNKAYDAREYYLFAITSDKGVPPDFFETPGWKALWQRPLTIEWRAAHDALAADLAAPRPPS